MKTSIIIIVMIFLIPASDIYSQVSQQWASTYNSSGTQNDVSVAVTYDAPGNVYVTGYITLSPTNTDIVTIKYNSAGIPQWASTYSGPSGRGDVPIGIVTDDSGNVYITGSSRDALNITDYVTVKYNSAGIEQWVRRYNGPGNSFDDAYGIVIDNMDNIIVTGSSYRSSVYYDYLTIKYNPSGDSVWVARSPGAVVSTEDVARAIFADDSGNVYVTGTRISGPSANDFGTIKYDSTGNELWHSFYSSPGSYDDIALAIAVDDSGNVFATGYIQGAGSMRNYATVKYNSSGVEQWVRTYNGPGNDWDEAYSIAVDHSGNAYVTGYSYGVGTEGDAATIKYTPAGDTSWIKRYNGPSGNGWDEGITVRTDASGNVYVAGSSYSPGGDIFVIKYSSAGDSLWGFRYNGPDNLNDEAKDMTIDALGNLYVTGRSNTNTAGYDFVTIKYGLPTAITPISSNVPESFSLLQNYPNPFNPGTSIKFKVKSLKHVELNVYDISGKEVARLVNQKLQPGTYEYTFDGSGLSSGIYFYTLTAGDFKETRRMVLLK